MIKYNTLIQQLQYVNTAAYHVQQAEERVDVVVRCDAVHDAVQRACGARQKPSTALIMLTSLYSARQGTRKPCESKPQYSAAQLLACRRLHGFSIARNQERFCAQFQRLGKLQNYIETINDHSIA